MKLSILLALLALTLMGCASTRVTPPPVMLADSMEHASGCAAAKLAEAQAIERRVAEQRESLRDAIARGDVDRARSLRSEIDSLVARAAQLRSEADACGGEGETEAQVTVVHDLSRRMEVSRGAADYHLTADMRAPAPAKPPAPSLPAPTPVAAPPGSPFDRDAPHVSSMLIHTAEISLAVFQVNQGLDAVDKIADASGGYLSTRTDQRITIRVPRERFAEAVAKIERLGDVLHRSVSAEDVTDQYVDLEMRLKNAYAVRARLVELLKGAAVRDAIEIQKELAKTTEEIERLEGRLKVLRDRIGYSTITVAFQATTPRPLESRVLLPFPFMSTVGLAPLLNVPVTR